MCFLISIDKFFVHCVAYVTEEANQIKIAITISHHSSVLQEYQGNKVNTVNTKNL